MIHQLKYTFTWKPTSVDVYNARQAWLVGRKQKSGVTVSPITWTPGGAGIRRAVADGFIGRAGVVKLYGAADLTLCDYDSGEWAPPVGFIGRIAKMINARPVWLRYDRTRRGWHLIIKWNRRFTPREIVAIQCVLGSDRKREAYNLARVLSGKARNYRWNLLFDYKL